MSNVIATAQRAPFGQGIGFSIKGHLYCSQYSTVYQPHIADVHWVGNRRPQRNRNGFRG